MHYRIDTVGRVEPAAIERLLHAIDAAAMVDADARAGGLRISTVVGADELSALLRDAGCTLGLGGIVRLPSDCCGGCGG